MPKIDILTEAKRLFDIGFGVHWIKKNSKAPVKQWNTASRDPWEQLEKEYRKGFGLGVRMGKASAVGRGYLANIDVDVKSGDPKDFERAAKAFHKYGFFGDNYDYGSIPTVKTGNGYRMFILTSSPMKSKKLVQSKRKCIVHMPTTEINDQQKAYSAEGIISLEQLENGYRVRPAWEIEFMSHGRQVVLPPSIHPDTQKPYSWLNGLSADAENIPMLSDRDIQVIGSESVTAAKKEYKGGAFKPVHVDLWFTDLSAEMVSIIVDGTGVTNNSDSLYSAALSMMRSGFTDNEIASVLTDKDNFLGRIAYKHRKTSNRSSAADWILRYTIPNARGEIGLGGVFSAPVTPAPRIESDEAIEAQVKSLTGKNNPGNWLTKIKKNKHNVPQSSQLNVVLILENAIAPDLFKYDLFRNRFFYSCDVPWIDQAKDRAVEDNDAVYIIQWLAQNYQFEPAKTTVENAIIVISSRNKFHPIREELNNLPEWDGVLRLDHVLKDYFNAEGDPEYLSQAFRKTMVASVKRTFEPGAEFPWMMILEGKQEAGKTALCKILFGETYHGDWLPNLADKDAALGLEGLRVFEFGELDTLHKTEINTAKAFISRQVDKVRPPFGKLRVELARQCVFIGTTNSDKYLKDETGNRRFVPVNVGSLDIKRLIKNREQLWAEAKFIYDNDLEPSFKLDGDAAAFLIGAHSEKMVEDTSTFMLHAFEKFVIANSQKRPSEQFNLTDFKIMDLWSPGFGPFSRWPEDQKHLQLGAKAIKKFGCVKGRNNKGAVWNLIPEE